MVVEGETLFLTIIPGSSRGLSGSDREPPPPPPPTPTPAPGLPVACRSGPEGCRGEMGVAELVGESNCVVSISNGEILPPWEEPAHTMCAHINTLLYGRIHQNCHRQQYNKHCIDTCRYTCR